MELKSRKWRIAYRLFSSSNCTFMELKYTIIQRYHGWMNVLIVPLWNWNKSALPVLMVIACSNCTFMELKLGKGKSKKKQQYGSNCTFMELKLGKGKSEKKQQYVLIVPLWNWNSLYSLKATEPLAVLIVPLWNWNHAEWWERRAGHLVLIVPLWNWNGADYRDHRFLRRSNCTFMELKFIEDQFCADWVWF